MKMYQSTSYIIGVETNSKLFPGMYINSEDPSISLRTAKYKDKRLLLVGGMDHKTGAKIDLKDHHDIPSLFYTKRCVSSIFIFKFYIGSVEQPIPSPSGPI